MIPDSVYAISLQVSQGLTAAAAHYASNTLTENFLAQNSYPFTTDLCNFMVVKSSSIVGSREYESYYAALIDLFSNDKKFNMAIHAFVNAYLSRQAHILTASPTYKQRCITLSCQFILSELAIAAYVVQQGYPVSLYPGSIELFHEISAGEYPDIPASLIRLINVGIRFRRLKGNGQMKPLSPKKAA